MPSDSGGGISPDLIPIPTWQQTTGVITAANGGSTSYRNIPDVAAEANTDNYICYSGNGGGEGTGEYTAITTGAERVSRRPDGPATWRW